MPIQRKSPHLYKTVISTCTCAIFSLSKYALPFRVVGFSGGDWDSGEALKYCIRSNIMCIVQETNELKAKLYHVGY